jgi:MarR family transcriptional regulator, organic hydroperoxide resistance regulator
MHLRIGRHVPVSAAKHRRRAPPIEAPVMFALDDHIFYQFSQILALRNRVLNIELRRFGLDYSRWRVMAVLNELPDCSMQQLADRTGVDRTTLVHTLRVMGQEGLISRRERASDRRSVALALTARGHASLAMILPAVVVQTERALVGFTALEAGALRKQLARVIGNLRN